MTKLATQPRKSPFYCCRELRRMLASANDLPDPPTDEPFGADDTCALLWSSGTTARAKGIKRSCLSFAQFSDTGRLFKKKENIF